jgi:MtN3 and saliva related transmembrane protein
MRARTTGPEREALVAGEVEAPCPRTRRARSPISDEPLAPRDARSYRARMIDAIGYAAALLTTVAFLPQAWLTYRTRKADGISLTMYSIFVVGIVLWLVYGVFVGRGPLIVANLVTLVLSSFILGMKVKYG